MPAPSASSSKPGPPSSSVSPARREAFAILLELEKGSAHADDLLRGSRVSKLPSQDRNLATTLVLGTLRWQIRLDAAIRAFLTKPNARLDPEIQIALRLGAFQLQHLDRIPAHAAIGESVALAKLAGHKFASGMVNAVLRKLAALPKAQPISESFADPRQLAEATAHPAWLVERWTQIYGPDTAQAICRHGQQQPELSIRLTSPERASELTEKGIELAPGAILTDARRVISGDITATESFQTGVIRVQEEGSQLIAELASLCEAGEDNNAPARILDACAAPGGKTLILAERNPQAKITACEISPSRFEALQARIAASPYAGQIEVQQADATKLSAPARYDLVLADVPCSGTGTLGRNPEIRHRLKPEDLVRHHQRQCTILRSALRASVKQVLYSTCSLEPEENQDVVSEVLADSSDWQQVSIVGRINELLATSRLTPAAAQSLQSRITKEGALLLLPTSLEQEIQTDGFFAALLERKS